MKPNRGPDSRKRFGVGMAFTNTCRASCRKVLAQIKAAKNAVFAESFTALQTQEHLLRLALNEAEALAWQTMYPGLVFPALATEKVEAVIAWNHRQQRRRPAGAVEGNNPLLKIEI